jgi:hypothetical protein
MKSWDEWIIHNLTKLDGIVKMKLYNKLNYEFENR